MIFPRQARKQNWLQIFAVENLFKLSISIHFLPCRTLTEHVNMSRLCLKETTCMWQTHDSRHNPLFFMVMGPVKCSSTISPTTYPRWDVCSYCNVFQSKNFEEKRFEDFFFRQNVADIRVKFSYRHCHEKKNHSPTRSNRPFSRNFGYTVVTCHQGGPSYQVW